MLWEPYGSRSGSSCDNEVLGGAWLVVVAIPLVSEPILAIRVTMNMAHRLSIQGYRLEVIFPDRKQLLLTQRWLCRPTQPGNLELWTMRAALRMRCCYSRRFGSTDRENLHQQWRQLKQIFLW